jgi:Integrase core domain
MAETTSSSDTKYSFFLFNGSNYAEWKFQSRVYAQKIKALEILEGSKTRPSDATEKAEFDKLNEQLFHHIFATMKSAQQQLLRTVPLGDGQAAYKHLQTIYEPQTRAAVKQLLKQLLTLKQNGREMAVFVTDIVDVSTKLNAALKETKISIEELLKILVLLDGLDPEHALLREQLLLDDKISFELASQNCITRAEIHSYERDDLNTASAKAARSGESYCPKCFEVKGKKFNHTVDKCYLLHPELKPKNGNGGRRGNGKHQRQGGSKKQEANANAAQSEQQKSGTAWVAQALSASSSLSDPEEDVQYKTFELDSCAFPHYVRTTAGIKNIDSSQRLTVASCGPATYSTSGAGTIGDHLPIGPLPVQVAPDFRSNLASVAMLCDAGLDVTFSKSGVTLMNVASKKVEYTGPRVGNVYQLRIKIPNGGAASIAKSCNTISDGNPIAAFSRSDKALKSLSLHDKIRLWHQRLPHPSAARMFEAISKEHIINTGIPTSTSLKEYEVALAGCQSCALGKARLPPHYRRPLPDNKTAQKPLEKIHFDIKTVNKRSWGNALYAGIVVDDFTREKFCIPLRYKSDTASSLVDFNTRITRPRQCNTKLFRCDRAGEQRGFDFRDYLSQCRIQPEYTSPGDSRGNGVAERTIETIESGANTYRVHGGLSVAAWAELYDTTCFCENFLPTSANPDKKSPREMLRGEPQDVSFMRTPGAECIVFVHPKHH